MVEDVLLVLPDQPVEVIGGSVKERGHRWRDALPLCGLAVVVLEQAAEAFLAEHPIAFLYGDWARGGI